VSQLHSTRHLQTMSLCLFAKLILPDPVSLQVVIGLCKRKETAALKIKAAVS